MEALTDGKGSPRCAIRPYLAEDHPYFVVFFLDGLAYGVRSGRSNRMSAGGVGATSSV
jgi:hypothetical protein